MKRVYAKRLIVYKGKEYLPGASIPCTDAGAIVAWLKADSVYADEPRKTTPKISARKELEVKNESI